MRVRVCIWMYSALGIVDEGVCIWMYSEGIVEGEDEGVYMDVQ